MSARTPILVGLVLIVATVALTWFVLSTSKDQFSDDQTYVLYGDFEDASGIRAKTRLQINGIDIGKIVDIKHVRNKDGRLVARVELRIAKTYDVYENAILRKVAESLLGDFRLDLDPGWKTDHDGNTYAKLPPGGIIPNVHSRSDLEEIQSQLRQVTSNVNSVTESFSKVLAGPEGEGSIKEILTSVERSMAAIEDTTRVLSDMVTRNDHIINSMIVDLGQFSGALASSTKPGGDLQQLAENLAHLSGRLDRIAAAVDGMVGDDPASEQRGRIQETLANLNSSIDSLNSIARKIDEGQGSLGRVVNDPTLISKVEDTVDDVHQLVGGISRMQTQIELRTQYEVPFYNDNAEIQQAVKNTLALRLVPRPDKYYILEAIADPRGTSTRRITTETANGSTKTVEVNEISFNDLKFSAQFAKRYYFVTGRFGIIENTGGVGLDFHALDDKLELRFDAFDFTRRDTTTTRRINPRLRSTAMVQLFDHVFAQGGIDDPFNRNLRTWFAGGALRFTDDDLKTLLTVAPSKP